MSAAADQFKSSGKVREIRAYGNGHVHDTYLVTLDDPGGTKFILQRLNTRVFRQPLLVIRNISVFTEHMVRRLEQAPSSPARRWEIPRLIVNQNGRDYWTDSEGFFWRAISFIEKAQSLETIQDMNQAEEVGWALATFHWLLSDLPINQLADTLEGFHITPRYLARYDQVRTKACLNRSPEIEYGFRFVDERRKIVGVLEEAKAQGRLRLRPIHGDPKVNNILFDTDTGKAVGLVDLDTVKPGLLQYDIGDCLRSGCNPLGEDIDNWEMVRFEADYCRGILQGYLPRAAQLLRPNDYACLYEAIRLIAFELGLRFFTDFLEGDIYFKVTRSQQNLIRALVHFKLTESIESQERVIRTLIQEIRGEVHAD